MISCAALSCKACRVHAAGNGDVLELGFGEQLPTRVLAEGENGEQLGRVCSLRSLCYDWRGVDRAHV
jgi:hypothetical protein